MSEMDTASGSREPRRGWFSRQASMYGPHSNNEVFVNIEDIEDTVPLREFPQNSPQLVWRERVAWEKLQCILYRDVITIKVQAACRRFAFAQYTLRKNDRAGERRSTSGAPDGESRQTSNISSDKRRLIASVQKELPEFDGFIQSRDWRINHDVSPNPQLPQNASLCEFLLYGPSIVEVIPEDPVWLDYSRAVKVLLSNPRNRNWLDEDLETFLGVKPLTDVVESDVVEEQTRTGPRDQFDEEAMDEMHAELERVSIAWRIFPIFPTFPTFGIGSLISSTTPARSTQNTAHRSSLPSHRLDGDPTHGSRPFSTLPRLCTLLYTPLATAVSILNITTALGYVMLMNDPSLPQHSYIIGTLVTWFLTAAMMIIHGIFTTGSMKDYARRLVILAMFTCFVVAVVFHFAGASNFASSFLVGITMAILLIQLW